MEKQNPYKVILTIIVGLLLVYYIYERVELLYISIVIGIMALVSNKVATLIVKGWTSLGYLLSLVFPPLMLGLIYFLLLTPIALLSRWSRRNDYLGLKNINSSQFKEVAKIVDAKAFEQMW